MANENLRFILINALPAAITRLVNLGLLSHRRNLCRAFAISFGLTETQGDDIFTNGVEKGQLDTIAGFDLSSYYNTYEDLIKNYINDSTSGLSAEQLNIFALSVHAVIFAYSLNQSIDPKLLYNTISSLIIEISNRITGIQPYSLSEGIAIHPFTDFIINLILSQNDYTLTLQNLSTSPRNFEIDLVHYNWYDTARLFAGPNLDLMKDAENQYYYISGQLLYSQLPSNLTFCEESEISFETPTGTITTPYINNAPCIDQNNFVGPKTGVKFYRVFNDGPYSSGDFTTEVKNQFISFDKEVLSGEQYKANASRLFNFEKQNGTGDYISIYNKSILNDINGEYNLAEEYRYSPLTTGCLPKYQIMRVGDARLRSQCSGYDIDGNCLGCQELLVTGFKYALLELTPEIWSGDFVYIKRNPYSTTPRIIKSALNLNSNPYKATEKDGELQTFLYDDLGNEIWYVGPPQLSGNDTLPYFAFVESFNNTTFEQRASIILYPSIGTSTPSLSGDSTRTFQVSNNPILSGIDLTLYSVLNGLENQSFPRAKFNATVSAFNLSDDDIKLKFFGMGNALSGIYSISATEEENAGYFYTGYILTDSSGNVINTETSFLNNFKNYKIGSSIKEVKYISGYTGNGNNIEMSRLYAHDNMGNNLQYYYFDNRLLPISVTNQTGWESFAPLPSGLENDSNYNRVYGRQKNENNFPRYYRGPYATLNQKFLYPNAKLIDIAYESKTNGFPDKYKYRITVREETVKEVYAKYPVIGGTVLDPELITIIRPNSGLGFDQEPSLGVSNVLFDTSDSNFDFNTWGTSGFMYVTPVNDTVHPNWSQSIILSITDGTPQFINSSPSGRNHVTYANPFQPFQSPTFRQGILLTGRLGSTEATDITVHGFITGIGSIGKINHAIKPASHGLFHGYTGYTITGEVTYTKPLFDLELGDLNKNPSIRAFPLMKDGCVSWLFCDEFSNCTESLATGVNNLYTKSLNGKIFTSRSGEDPLYFENVGGRRGSDLAKSEGGYHSKELIGDSWLGLSYKKFGYYCSINGDTCYPNSDVTGFPVDALQISNRVPEDDQEWILFDLKPDYLNIHTRGLNYNPMGFNYSGNPSFTSNSLLTINGTETSSLFKEDIQALYFDLNDYFPLREVTGNGEWYFNPSGTGLEIGPFDRDVELFADRFYPLSGYTQMHINSWRITDYFEGSNDSSNICSPRKFLSGDSTLFPSSPSKNFYNIKPFFYIPSGERAIINIRSYTGSLDHTGEAATYIGFPDNSFLNIRARSVLNEFEVTDTTQALLKVLGSNFWLHNNNMINNGSERTFKIENPDGKFENLNGKTFTFTTFSRTGKMFNIKPLEDILGNTTTNGISVFNSYYQEDSFGNVDFTFEDMEDLFKKESSKRGETFYISGWREGSRLSFTFENITVSYDALPYVSYNVVIPSGNCQVSGEMGYLSQADNTIFSEGFYLKDMTSNDTIREKLYGPSFVSEVIKRVPSFTFPSGDFAHPILSAPSTMKQRKNRFFIDIDQAYSGISSYPPANFNKLLWPALSDLKTLNPEETLEELPPDDGNTFLNDQILISASQGQRLSNGRQNPNLRKIYVTQNQYQMYDSIATDAVINSRYFITSGFGFETKLDQPLSGVLVSKGTTLTEVKAGLV